MAPRQPDGDPERSHFRARLLGCELRRMRTSRGLTLTGLARAAGISPSFLSEIERGKKTPSLSSLDQLSAALGVNRDLLVPPPDVRPDSPGLPGRVRRAREHVGLTQNQLATLTAVSPSLIAQVEAGTTQPSLATVEKLAMALRISACYLLADEPDAARVVADLGIGVRTLIDNPDGLSLIQMAAEMDGRSLGLLLELARTIRRLDRQP